MRLARVSSFPFELLEQLDRIPYLGLSGLAAWRLVPGNVKGFTIDADRWGSQDTKSAWNAHLPLWYQTKRW